MNVKPSSIDNLLTSHQTIALDSNVLIYLLEASGTRAEAAGLIVDAVGEARVVGILSTVGLIEVLVGPARIGDGASFERAAATIRDVGFAIVGLDAATAEEAALIRGKTGASVPDAIHLACAQQGGASVFVTNDRRMPALPRLEIAILDDLIP